MGQSAVAGSFRSARIDLMQHMGGDAVDSRGEYQQNIRRAEGSPAKGDAEPCAAGKDHSLSCGNPPGKTG